MTQRPWGGGEGDAVREVPSEFQAVGRRAWPRAAGGRYPWDKPKRKNPTMPENSAPGPRPARIRARRAPVRRRSAEARKPDATWEAPASETRSESGAGAGAARGCGRVRCGSGHAWRCPTRDGRGRVERAARTEATQRVRDGAGAASQVGVSAGDGAGPRVACGRSGATAAARWGDDHGRGGTGRGNRGGAGGVPM